MYISKEKLQKIFFKATASDISEFHRVFSLYAAEYGINSKLREDIFLAQILTEVGADLKPKSESMNYSVAGLKKIFKWFRKHPAEASAEGRSSKHKADQKHIAEHAYDSRLGNKAFPSLDGWTFRGQGYLQLTGRANYTKIAKELEMTANELSNKIGGINYALLSALVFWHINGIYKCSSVDCATKKVNRYTDTYELRRANYNKVVSA